MNKQRILGLDLLRIISMCGIIGLHVINQGGLIQNGNIYNISYYFILFLLIIFFTSVDVFGILSGYINIEKEKNKHRRIVELIVIVIYYCLVIPSIYYIINFKKISFNYKDIMVDYIPILKGNYWYITNYTLLFFLIPYINKFCKSLTQNQYKKLLIILLIFLSFIPNLLLEKVDLFKIDYGYSAFWLIYCYMIGGYLKLYNINLEFKKAAKYFMIVLLISFTISSIIRNISFLVFKKIIVGSLLIDYISPLTIILSILLLIIFSNINIINKVWKKIIIYLSSASFSVYIIHAHRVIFYNYFKDLFVPLLNYNFIIITFGIIIAIVLIYIVCTILDEFRIWLFKILKLEKIINKFGNKLDNLLN